MNVENWLRARTVEEGECLIWTQCCNGNGHPSATINRKRSLSVRRWVYEQYIGSPAGKHIVPTCGNRKCVNPAHLKAVTSSEKNRLANWGTSAVTLSRQRTGRSGSPLTIEAVRAMRAERAQGAKLSDLSAKYGVHESRVSSICRGKSWRDGASPWAALLSTL
jgi:hypothetical protein